MAFSLPFRWSRRRDRSSQASPRASYDVVIIGGGAMAFALAYELGGRQHPKRVMLLDPGPGTDIGVPGVAPLRMSWPAPELVALAQASRGQLSRIGGEIGLGSEWRPFLDLAFSPADLADLNTCADTALHLGEQAWLVPLLEIQSHLPFLERSGEAALPVLGALFEPKVAVTDRLELARAYRRATKRSGMTIVESDTIALRRTPDGEAVEVRVGGEPVVTGAVVLAVDRGAGVWLRRIGLPYPLSRAEALFVESERYRRLTSTIAAFRRFDGCISRSGAGTATIALCMERAGAAPLEALGGVLAFAPALGRLHIAHQRKAGFDRTFDGAPLLGPAGLPGLFIAAGLGFENAALVPAAAEALAAEIRSGERQTLIDPFSPARFLSGRLLGTPREEIAA
jgi:sarcosine oxidase subunit beta